jgi:hypothetical protein
MTGAFKDAWDVGTRGIGDTTPRTADRRVERGGRDRRQHGVFMAADSTTVEGPR